MGTVDQLRKRIPMLEADSINRLDESLKSNDASVGDKLIALYYHTESPLEMVLIEEVCRQRSIALEVEDITPPKMVG